MKRIREINVNTKEYWDKFSTDAYQAADLRRGGNLYKFFAVKELINENLNILDIGCLNGNFYNFLKERNFKMKIFTGIDLSEKLIERAKNRFPEQTWFISECHALPFENEKFDVVLLMEILEHIEEPELALLEAKRVCKKDGIIIITVPNKTKINDGAHVWLYEIEDIKKMLSKISSRVEVKLIVADRNILGKCIV